ncbi:MAG: glycosyltransferase [Geobacter sp.]|nr:glycosyltransferase [Geobacter sp.]
MFSFITCATDPALLQRCLLASPCLASGEYSQQIYMRIPSAGAAFNREMTRQQQARWLVWVHQDVFLPDGWDTRFIAAIAEAECRFPRLAVVGVYGISGVGEQAQRAGHVLDRGTLLQELVCLPCLVDSIDELLFAVRTDSGLRLDPTLGFDFYGTDLALQAQEQGFKVAVVDAYCEHWSTTPREAAPSRAVLERVAANGKVFEDKWAHRLPLETPCFSIQQPGDVAAQCRAFGELPSHASTEI